MSKYIYATVYEQFTGLKPPEPKSHKPRRRRGYGHPYRMRLNMQDEEQQDLNTENNESSDFEISKQDRSYNLDEDSQARFIPAINQVKQATHARNHRRKSNYSARSEHTRSSDYAPIIEEPGKDSHPKVTYKKRRSLNTAIL